MSFMSPGGVPLPPKRVSWSGAKNAAETSAARMRCQMCRAARARLRVRRLALLVRAAHVLRARRAVVGPAVRRLRADVDVDEPGARIDADAHAAHVERLHELVQLLVGDSRD